MQHRNRLDRITYRRALRRQLTHAEAILWRMGPETFRIESQRSFAAYHASLLKDAMRALTAF